MNLLQMAQRSKREAGVSGSGPSSIAAAVGDDRRLVDWIADEWSTIQRKPCGWKWMRATRDAGPLVAGEQGYTGASLGITDFGAWLPPSRKRLPFVYEVANPTRRWPLQHLDYERFRRDHLQIQSAPGAPQIFSIAPDGKLLLSPAPQAGAAYAISIDYRKAATVLASDGDTPNMPSEFHMILVWRSVMEAGLFFPAPELLTRAQNNHQGLMDELMASQAEEIEFEIVSRY